jgi:hypothetical protein
MAYICKPINKLLREALDAPDGLFISRHRDYGSPLKQSVAEIAAAAIVRLCLIGIVLEV